MEFLCTNMSEESGKANWLERTKAVISSKRYDSHNEELPKPGTASHPRRSVGEAARDSWREFVHTFFTYDGLIGDVDYGYLFRPTIPFTKWKSQPPQFFSLHSRPPLLLTAILGLQHAMAMMGGLVSPSLIFASAANLSTDDEEYLVSASLLGAGILTVVQVLRIRIPYTSLFIGTGMISVLGETFATVPVFQSAVPTMYSSGFCPTDDQGNQLACRKAYGAFLGTGALCALLQFVLSFVPPKALHRLFPPIVTGPVVLLIGAALAQTGVEDWAGGSDCTSSGALCNSSVPSHAHEWGSGQWVGLGFTVIVVIVLCDKFGAPIMKSCSIIIGLLVGCIVAAATGYFQHESIDQAPNGQFAWVRTFPLTIYGPIVLPILAVYIIAVMESIGDITASAEVSRVDVEGVEFDSRIQGGIMASGLASIIGCLMTLTPMGTFAQNNGVIAMTQAPSRRVGFACCFWLLIMGVVGKFSAAIVAIPRAVIGGMTTFLFTSVAVSGLAIIGRSSFNRRDRMVLAVALVFGFAGLLEPTWFSKVFTYKGSNSGKKGFINAIVIVVETPYAICGVVGAIANLLLPQQDDAEDVEGYAIDTTDSSNVDFEANKTKKEGDLEPKKSIEMAPMQA